MYQSKTLNNKNNIKTKINISPQRLHKLPITFQNSIQSVLYIKIKTIEPTIQAITPKTGDDQISILQWSHDIKTSYHSTTINSQKGGLWYKRLRFWDKIVVFSSEFQVTHPHCTTHGNKRSDQNT